MVLGVYGHGHIFGDMDAFIKREYLYTLRAKTHNVVILEIDATMFMNSLRAVPAHHNLEIFKKVVRE